MQACDFTRSFLWFRIDETVKPSVTKSHEANHTTNKPRIQLECICDLAPPDGPPVRYVLGASCKTERCNVESDIWIQPNADFCLVLGDEHFLIIKRYDHTARKMMNHPPEVGEQPHRQLGRIKDAYVEVEIGVNRTDGEVLETVQQVIDAGMTARPIVAVTEFDTEDGHHCRLEYPIKTLNLCDREMFYQSDTGPLLYPVRPGRHDPTIESFRLAYLAANAPDWAELLINVPTALSDGITVDHYAQGQRIDCRNTLIALDLKQR